MKNKEIAKKSSFIGLAADGIVGSSGTLELLRLIHVDSSY